MRANDKDGKPLIRGTEALLLEMPESVVHDLPEDEKEEMRAHAGGTVVVERIENDGLVWVGFGSTEDDEDEAHYSGHSFSIEPTCLRVKPQG